MISGVDKLAEHTEKGYFKLEPKLLLLKFFQRSPKLKK